MTSTSLPNLRESFAFFNTHKILILTIKLEEILHFFGLEENAEICFIAFLQYLKFRYFYLILIDGEEDKSIWIEGLDLHGDG